MCALYSPFYIQYVGLYLCMPTDGQLVDGHVYVRIVPQRYRYVELSVHAGLSFSALLMEFLSVLLAP